MLPIVCANAIILDMANLDKKIRKPNWDDVQMKVLAEGVERRIDTIKGKFSPSLTQEKKQAAWRSVTACINAVTIGCQRSVEEVKKRWQDAQSAVKKKEANRLKQATATGGGPAPDTFFKCWEKIVLRTLSPTAVSGIDGGVDTAAKQIQDSSVLLEQGPAATLIVSVCDNGSPMTCELEAATPCRSFDNESSSTCVAETPSCENGLIKVTTVHISGNDEVVSASCSETPVIEGKKSARKSRSSKAKSREVPDLPAELLLLKRQKMEQERSFQQQLLSIEQDKAQSLKDIMTILKSINNNISTAPESPSLSVSPIVKFLSAGKIDEE